MNPEILCPSCGGRAVLRDMTQVVGQNVIERVRQCASCDEEFSSFEVVAGTAITWRETTDAAETCVSRIEEAPQSPAQALKSRPETSGDYANCRSCGTLFKPSKGHTVMCRPCKLKALGLA